MGADTSLPEAGTQATVICNAQLADARVDVEVDGTLVAAVRPAGESPRCGDAGATDASAFWLSPSFIDSHVHLAYYPVGAELIRTGIAAAVDLAAPVETLREASSPLRVASAGPILTAPQGYPTQSWGAGGFGLEVDGPDAAEAAARQLADEGAQLLKLAFTGASQLDDASVTRIMEVAASRHLPVAVHAMDDAAAARAAELGIDLLAHTPTQPLTAETVEAWREGTVITTLHAFGSTGAAIENLRALADAGARVLYGTDLGNSRRVGIQAPEIEALVAAGFSGREIIDMGTRVPAAYWGWEDLGAIEAGKRASLMLLTADPREAPTTLAEPAAVLVDGRWREPLPPAGPPEIGL